MQQPRSWLSVGLSGSAEAFLGVVIFALMLAQQARAGENGDPDLVV